MRLFAVREEPPPRTAVRGDRQGEGGRVYHVRKKEPGLGGPGHYGFPHALSGKPHLGNIRSSFRRFFNEIPTACDISRRVSPRDSMRLTALTLDSLIPVTLDISNSSPLVRGSSSRFSITDPGSALFPGLFNSLYLKCK